MVNENQANTMVEKIAGMKIAGKKSSYKRMQSAAL